MLSQYDTPETKNCAVHIINEKKMYTFACDKNDIGSSVATTKVEQIKANRKTCVVSRLKARLKLCATNLAKYPKRKKKKKKVIRRKRRALNFSLVPYFLKLDLYISDVKEKNPRQFIEIICVKVDLIFYTQEK